jgi:penicillin-binding protein 1A
MGEDAAAREPFGEAPDAAVHAIVGVSAAAREYFGLAPDALSWAQSALIAGLPQAPSRNDPRCHPERALGRRAWVLRSLFEQGALTAE